MPQYLSSSYSGTTHWLMSRTRKRTRTQESKLDHINIFSLPRSLCLIMARSKARAHVVYYPTVDSDGICVLGHCCLRNKISNVRNLTGSPFSPIGPAGPTPPGRPGWPIAPAGPEGPLSPVAPWKWEEIKRWGECITWFTLWFNVAVTITDHHGNSLLPHTYSIEHESWAGGGMGGFNKTGLTRLPPTPGSPSPPFRPAGPWKENKSAFIIKCTISDLQ